MSARRVLLVLAGLACAWLASRVERADPRPPLPLAARVLGPAAGLVADLEWIGFQSALLAGDEGAALSHAERALRLAPRDARGWRALSAHLGLDRAAPAREPDPTRRARLLGWAVELAREGEAWSGDRATLAFHRGVLLLTHAEQDPDIAWPGGREALLVAAAEAFEEAVAAGRAEAEPLARVTRARAGAPPGATGERR